MGPIQLLGSKFSFASTSFKSFNVVPLGDNELMTAWEFD